MLRETEDEKMALEPEIIFDKECLSYSDLALWPPITIRELFSHTKLEQIMDCLGSSGKKIGKVVENTLNRQFFQIQKEWRSSK